jgi:hypothetical protein
MQQLYRGEKQGDGQRAAAETFRDENLKPILNCNERDLSVVYATGEAMRLMLWPAWRFPSGGIQVENQLGAAV